MKRGRKRKGREKSRARARLLPSSPSSEGKRRERESVSETIPWKFAVSRSFSQFFSTPRVLAMYWLMRSGFKTPIHSYLFDCSISIRLSPMRRRFCLKRILIKQGWGFEQNGKQKARQKKRSMTPRCTIPTDSREILVNFCMFSICISFFSVNSGLTSKSVRSFVGDEAAVSVPGIYHLWCFKIFYNSGVMRNAVRQSYLKWPTGRIPYTISTQYSSIR